MNLCLEIKLFHRHYFHTNFYTEARSKKKSDSYLFFSKCLLLLMRSIKKNHFVGRSD